MQLNKKSISFFGIYSLIFIFSLILGGLIIYANNGMNFILLDGDNTGNRLYSLSIIVFSLFLTLCAHRIINHKKNIYLLSIIWMAGIPFLMLCYGFWQMQFGLIECADALANAPFAQRDQQILAGISICGNYGLIGFSFAAVEGLICMITYGIILNNYQKHKFNLNKRFNYNRTRAQTL
jgi:hypothetical protein